MEQLPGNIRTTQQSNTWFHHHFFQEVFFFQWHDQWHKPINVSQHDTVPEQYMIAYQRYQRQYLFGYGGCFWVDKTSILELIVASLLVVSNYPESNSLTIRLTPAILGTALVLFDKCC
mmetsp:Transcript_11178/g.26927  ORF Transcript_11178/g.26927 Transcript_11178/m.26927 type:complete len:118 (+) Transcript_11178:47-400(+)